MWLRGDQVAPEADPLGTSVHVDPGHQRTRSGILVAGAPRGWISGSHISHSVGPLGTTDTQILVPWGPAVYGHLGKWLRGDQVALEVGPLGTISARTLVTRGPASPPRGLRREEGGSLVTRFRAQLLPQGPPARKSWSRGDRFSTGIKGVKLR